MDMNNNIIKEFDEFHMNTCRISTGRRENESSNGR